MQQPQPPPRVLPTSVPRRRNGRQQACEPCRKRKLACDHSLPSCQRCRRRNAEAGCVYLIPDPISARQPAGTPSRLSHPRPAARHATFVSPPGSASSAAATSDDGEPGTGPGTMSPPPGASDSPGYLGPTSFSAVFREASDQLSQPASQPSSNAAPESLFGRSPETATTVTTHAGGSAASTTGVAAGPSRMDEYLRVIETIPRPELGRLLFRGNQSPMDGWVRQAMGHIMESMWETFGDCLGACSRAGLAAMAELVSTNTATPLDEDVDEPADWLSFFSGRNLRWEAVGIAFVCFCFGAMEHTAAENPDGSGLHGTVALEPRQAMLLYKDCALKCADFCRDAPANSLLLCLSYKNAVLESMVSGDTSLRCTVMMAETAALCMYLGLHVDPSADRPVMKISISAEARRRLFYGVFVVDKVASIVTGRPPLISRRYVSTELPLDVSNEELMLSRSQLEEVAKDLDPQGWSRAQKLTPVKYMRARINSAIVRDEILEIALGAPSIRPSHDQLTNLKEKELCHTAQLPDILVFKPADLKNEAVGVMELYGKIILRLEHLQNMFFLERLLARVRRVHAETGHQPPASQELLEISLEIVALTVTLWTHRDRIAGLHRDFEWLVISYAAPASGVLCMELLRPTPQRQQQQQQQQQQRQQRQIVSNGPAVSRSNMIQQLSLLASFLDWFGPSAPNAKLCIAVKETIQRVLGQVLNGPGPASAAAIGEESTMAGVGDGQPDAAAGLDHHQQQQTRELQDAGPAAGVQPQFQDFDFSLNITEHFNFDLMDTFDFLRPEYPDYQN